jgi:carbamoyl-phosphate synthase large subunit
MMNNFTIIRSALASLPSAGIVRLFQENGLRVIGTDIIEESSARYLVDGFYKVSRSTPENAEAVIREYLDIVKKEKARWIVSGPENEVILLARYENLFSENGCCLFHPPLTTLEIITDKLLLSRFLGKNNILSAPSFSPADTKGIKSEKIVVKPRHGRGSAGVRILQNKKPEIKKEIEHLSPDLYVVQPFLRGKEYTVDVLCDDQGKILGIVPRERLAVESGIAIAARTVQNQNLVDAVSALCSAISMRGFNCIQFIEEDGQYYLTDVNPRIGGGSILSLHSSDHLRKNLIAMLKNEKTTTGAGTYKIEMMFRHYNEIYV